MLSHVLLVLPQRGFLAPMRLEGSGLVNSCSFVGGTVGSPAVVWCSRSPASLAWSYCWGFPQCSAWGLRCGCGRKRLPIVPRRFLRLHCDCRNGIAGVHSRLRDVMCGYLTLWCSVDPALMLRSIAARRSCKRASDTMRHFRSVFVRPVFIACAALMLGAFALSSAVPQHSVARAETSVQDDAKQDELKQNFLNEHELGRRFRIDPADLPAPKTGRSSPIGR